MPNHPIHIERINPDRTLRLSDRGHSKVGPGHTVTWIINNNSGVKAILGIDKKPGSVNVFSEKPKQLGGSTNWRGTIDPGINREKNENYYINYIDDDNVEDTHDPRIQVLPTRSDNLLLFLAAGSIGLCGLTMLFRSKRKVSHKR